MTRVEASGSKKAPLVVVGEAPGAEEAKEGKPFVGRSGDLLFRQLMPSFGLTRAHCYVTNVVKERPARNDISPFVKFGTVSVKESEAFLSYREELRKELEETSANVILAVGNTPLWALCGVHGISKWRGSVLESTLLPGRKVIPTFHPASALRTPIQRHIIAMDLARAKEEMGTPLIQRPRRNYLLSPSYEETLEYIETCKRAERVAFDIEVTNNHVNCISLSPGPTEAMSIPFASMGGKAWFTEEEETDVWIALASLLEDPSVRKLAQNGAFDSWFLYKELGIRVTSMDDTMIAQKMCWPDFPAGLDFLCSVYTDEPYYKDDGKVWKRVKATDEDFRLYNAKDSVVLHEIMDVLEGDLDKLGLRPHYEEKLRTIKPLILMTEQGMLVDKEALKEEKKIAKREAKALQEEILTLIGIEGINIDSNQQLGEYFYFNLGIKPYKGRKQKEPSAVKRKRAVEILMERRPDLDEKTATRLEECRRGSVDEEALKRLAGTHGREEARLILRYREHTKYIRTYLNAKLDPDGRLRGTYNTVGTTSGRFSSSKSIFGTGLNVQNMPHRFKRLLVADPGFLLVAIDLGQAENRVVAYIAPDLRMQAAFEKGEDIHSLTAAMIFDKPVEEVTRADGTCPIGSGRFSERFWGKKANHSSNYGEGYYLFALQNEIPQREAKRILAGYHKAYPGVERWHKAIDNQVWEKRSLSDCFGKSRTYKGQLQRNKNKDAYSYPAQSTVREIMSRWGLCFVYESPLFQEVPQVNDVHDSMELLFLLSRGWTWIAKRILAVKKNLEQPLTGHGGKTFVIPADVEVGFRFAGLAEVPPEALSCVSSLAAWLEENVKEPS